MLQYFKNELNGCKNAGEKGHRYQKGRHTSHVSTMRMVRARTKFVVQDNFLVAAPTKKKKKCIGNADLDSGQHL